MPTRCLGFADALQGRNNRLRHGSDSSEGEAAQRAQVGDPHKEQVWASTSSSVAVHPIIRAACATSASSVIKLIS